VNFIKLSTFGFYALQRLNEVSQIELGFSQDFLQNDVIRDRLFDGTFNFIENHRSD